MPSKSFLSLPSEKKNRIFDAAIKEFANKPFEKATVTNICTNAGIPRRTFYSYFDSLDDIYHYIYQELEKKCDESIHVNALNGEIEDYFINLLESEEGLKKLYRYMESKAYDEKIKIHAAISISMEYKLGMIDKDSLITQINSLFN